MIYIFHQEFFSACRLLCTSIFFSPPMDHYLFPTTLYISEQFPCPLCMCTRDISFYEVVSICLFLSCTLNVSSFLSISLTYTFYHSHNIQKSGGVLRREFPGYLHFYYFSSHAKPILSECDP